MSFVYNSSCFKNKTDIYWYTMILIIYETEHDMLTAALASIDEIKHAPYLSCSSGGSPGTSNANDSQCNETHRSWDIQQEHHFACTCDSKQKWQRCPGIRILAHPEEPLKTQISQRLLINDSAM